MTEASPRVTVRLLAGELGVSHTTVSRALQDDTRISPSTRQRVQAAAARLGYVPNSHGRALATGRSLMFAFVVPYDIAAHPGILHSRVLEGFAQAVSRHGYSVNLTFKESLTERHLTLNQYLRGARVDGAALVLDSAHPPEGFADGVDYPVVAVNQVVNESGVDSVVAREHDGARAATRHLVAQGHRELVHIGAPLELAVSRSRRDGFFAALEEAGISVDEDRHSVEAAETLEGGYSAMTQLLKTETFTAAFCGVDLIAAGALQALREARRLVPDDVALVGYDDDCFSSFLSPALTTVAKPRREMGEKAAELLLRHANQSESSTETQVIELGTRLLIRGSSIRSIPQEDA